MKKLESYGKNGKTVWIGSFYPEKINQTKRLKPEGKVYAEIYKTKIYAMKKDKKGTHVTRKIKISSLSEYGKSDTGFEWITIDPSLLSTNKNDVIDIMKIKYKKHIENVIKQHQDFVDSEDERILKEKQKTEKRKSIIKQYEHILNDKEISADDFHWNVNLEDETITSRKLFINENKKMPSTFIL
tara:strand:+ start:332 stop:886 length:555 start_codon:yes stop_codon:yes gene_type:complete